MMGMFMTCYWFSGVNGIKVWRGSHVSVFAGFCFAVVFGAGEMWNTLSWKVLERRILRSAGVWNKCVRNCAWGNDDGCPSGADVLTFWVRVYRRKHEMTKKKAVINGENKRRWCCAVAWEVCCKCCWWGHKKNRKDQKNGFLSKNILYDTFL